MLNKLKPLIDKIPSQIGIALKDINSKALKDYEDVCKYCTYIPIVGFNTGVMTSTRCLNMDFQVRF